MRRIERALLGLVTLVVLALCVGVLRERWARRRDARRHPPPGRMVEYRGRRSHLDCTGSGSPTVVLQSEFGILGSLEWTRVQPAVARETRVCSYDRAGMLWSEARPGPRDGDRIADELHGILQAAGERPPYVMVGHSRGGILIRIYDHRFPGQVAGFVFVDASNPEQFQRYAPRVDSVTDRVYASLPSRLRTRIYAATGWWRHLSHRPPGPVRAYQWRSIAEGFYGELDARDATFREAAETGSLAERPVVVLTAGVALRYPGVPDRLLKEQYDTWLELQDELAARSTNSLPRVVEGATHQIPEEKPGSVVTAVREVVEAVRTGAPLRPESVNAGQEPGP